MHRIRFLKKSEKIWLCCATRKALITAIQQFIFNNAWILKCLRTSRPFHIFQKALERFLKVIDCTQQLQVRENVVRFEKALGAVKMIKDQIQYGSQSLFNLARGYFSADRVTRLVNHLFYGIIIFQTKTTILQDLHNVWYVILMFTNRM